LKFYSDIWDKEWDDNVLIVKDYSMQNYKDKGAKFISDYYDRYKPFNQMTIIGLETQDLLELSDGNHYHIRIDKLACVDDVYYVCDYKTNSTLMDQESADSDKQLAMYSIWVKNKFKDAKKVILLWNMLAFDKEIISFRTDEELEELHLKIVEKIKEIESCKDFPRKESGLCDYCVYKQICPSFKHAFELQEKNINEFKDDDGLKLVDEFSIVKNKMSELKKKERFLKEKIIDFAKQKNIDKIYGSNKKVSVKEFVKVVLPEDKKGFQQLLKDKGFFDKVAVISHPKISSLILKNEFPADIMSLVAKEIDYRLSLSNRKNDEE
jgi:putative RecB family exonuclease